VFKTRAYFVCFVWFWRVAIWQRCKHCKEPDNNVYFHSVQDIDKLQAIEILIITMLFLTRVSRSQWSCSIRRGSAAARVLGFWVRILSGTCMSVSCECCVFSGTGRCDGLMTCPKESYRLWCVWVWSWSLDREEAWAH
jgi:hypothetical protein